MIVQYLSMLSHVGMKELMLSVKLKGLNPLASYNFGGIGGNNRCGMIIEYHNKEYEAKIKLWAGL